MSNNRCYVIAIYDAFHGKQKLEQHEVFATTTDFALEKAYKSSTISQEVDFDYFLKKIGKRFLVNMIEV